MPAAPRRSAPGATTAGSWWWATSRIRRTNAPRCRRSSSPGAERTAELALREPGFWTANRIELRLGTRIDSDRPARPSGAHRPSVDPVEAARPRDRRPRAPDTGPGRHGRHPPPAHPRRRGDAAGRARARRSPRDRRSGLRGARGRLERPRARPRGHGDRAGARPVRADARSGGRLPPRRACPERRRRPAPGHAGGRRRARWRCGLCGGAGRRDAAGLRRRPGRRRRPTERRARRGPVRPRAGRRRPDRRLRADGGRWRIRVR